MAAKPKLHYINERGRMEPIRWLLAAAGIEFDECFVKTKDDLLKLRTDGFLLFQQVPMVEIDGVKMVQTRAILNYIAAKYNLYGKDLKERALNYIDPLCNLPCPIGLLAQVWRTHMPVVYSGSNKPTSYRIDMYVEGLFDLNELLMTSDYLPADEKEQQLATALDKATNRYFPVFEKVLKDHGQDFLVGNRFSKADVQLLEVLLMAEERKPDILAQFPLLQSFKARISNIPTIKKFLQPGSQRKSLPRQEDIPNIMKIFE